MNQGKPKPIATTDQKNPADQTPEPSDAATVTKSPKSAITIILAIFALAVTVAAVIFAYLYFSQSATSTPPTDMLNCQETRESPDNQDSTNAPETMTITVEPLLPKEIDEKVAIILFGYKGTVGGQTIETGPDISHDDIALFENGNLDQEVKVNHIIKSLWPSAKISGDDVRTKYKEVFGADLPVGAPDALYCGRYEYNSEGDFYFPENNTGGCGGWNNRYRFYYVNQYTLAGDNAYIYISTALVDYYKEPAIVYCDVAAASDGDKVCATLSEEKTKYDFTLDESNYQDYSQYRMIFNRADDGSFYFSHVEKL